MSSKDGIPADRGFIGPDDAPASINDPFQGPHIFAESRPEELPSRSLAKSVCVENLRRPLDQLPGGNRRMILARFVIGS
jgi:hypothetical protein